MSRPIKFRAWNKASKDMAYDVAVMGAVTTEQGNEVLMQYTGLKDRNDKDIYEGDIISGEYCGGEVQLGWSWRTYEGGSTYGWVVGTEKWPLHDECEVIGNIYENPELLSKERKGDDTL